MRVALFVHSLASCWNHGNAHFLRGIARDLLRRGHEVRAFEPAEGWSRRNLVRDHGPGALDAWRAAYPGVATAAYPGEEGPRDLDAALDRVDLALVHEWNHPALVRALGRRRARGGRFLLLFHDTHHRAASAPEAFPPDLLDGYDGVLAFGASLRERWLRGGWGGRAWIWHEAADTALFRPPPAPAGGDRGPARDLVWVGNWGDGEREAELRAFLIEPARALGLRGRVHGVRWPGEAVEAAAAAGLEHAGWLPNHEVPRAFAEAGLTLHVPRRPYVEALPGIPTIRVFEALACGIPLLCSPWSDSEGLFGPGCYLVARDTEAMTAAAAAVRADPGLRAELVANGLAAVRGRHTCAHRVDELLAIAAEIGGGRAGSDRAGVGRAGAAAAA